MRTMTSHDRPEFARAIWHRGKLDVHDVRQLDQTLDEIADAIKPEMPQGVCIERANGDTLMIVLGGDQSVLSFVAASGDPPYFTSLGDASAQGVWAYFVDGDHISETDAWQAIASSEARVAAREFVTMTTGLPRCVTWAVV